MTLQFDLLPKIQMPPLSSVSSSSSRASATKYVYKQEHTTPLCPSLRHSCCPQWTTRFQTGCAPCTNGKFAPAKRENFAPCPGKIFSLTREKILAAQRAGHSPRHRPPAPCKGMLQSHATPPHMREEEQCEKSQQATLPPPFPTTMTP